MTAAVQMPLFVFADFADYTVTWLAAHPLALLLSVAGSLALLFVALLWHDTKDDARSEMDDTAPRVTKVVQFKPDARVYTGDDYAEMVRLHQSLPSASQAEIRARVNARADELARETRAKRDQSRRETR